MDVNPYESPREGGYLRLSIRAPSGLFDWRKVLLTTLALLSGTTILGLSLGIGLAWLDRNGILSPAIKEWLR